MENENGGKRYSSLVKPRKCPNCGKETVVPSVTGYPGDGMVKNIIGAKLIDGATCPTTGDEPEWGCTVCGIEIYREEIPGDRLWSTIW